MPGEGEAALRLLLRTLAHGGYQGYLVIEPHLARRLSHDDGPARLGAAVDAPRALLDPIEHGP